MTLQEVFDQLACAELNNIYVTDQVTKEIMPEHYMKVATAINSGLTALHTRFLLRTGELKVVLQPDQEAYELKKRNEVGKDGVFGPTKYLRTAPDFKDNMLKVQQVFDDCNRELGLNNHSDYFSVHETSMDTIVVPREFLKTDKTKELRIVYRQDHKMIPARCDDLDPECYGLSLPRSHLWALCLFVAARMHVPIGLQDATYSGNSFMALYNTECQRLESESLQLNYIGVSHGVVRRGFP